MRYWACKCGKSEHWTSGMVPPPCVECGDCHTVASQDPKNHVRAIPHEFMVGEVETDDGMKPLSMCKWCLKTRSQIEKMAKSQGDQP